MVDTARYFMDFICDESCGKCLPCRNGTRRMLEILERITEGKGQPEDLELLEELAGTIQQTAMCGLGQTAPNPVLSTLKYFRSDTRPTSMRSIAAQASAPSFRPHPAAMHVLPMYLYPDICPCWQPAEQRTRTA